MLIKSQDGATIINMNNVLYINIDYLSKNCKAVITAYFNNGNEEIIGKYNNKEEADKKLNDFYRAFHERNMIFDF